MTRIERVHTALAGDRPDRVPYIPKIWVDFAARTCAVPLERVIEDPCTALEVILQTGIACSVDAVRQFPFPVRRTERRHGILVEVDAANRMIGTIDVEGGLQTSLTETSDFPLSDPVTMSYYQHRRPPEPVLNTIADVESVAVPTPELLDELGFDRNQIATLASVRSNPDMPAVIQDCGPIGIAAYASFNGMNRAMLDLFDRPNVVHAALDRLDEIAIVKGLYWLSKGYRILRINDSAGNMSVLSPDHWRAFVKPHFTAVVTELHRHRPDSLLYCHICGNTMPIIEDLIDTGLDCIAPIDPLGGMSVARAAAAVDGRAALMGGINTVSLVDACPEEIVRQARNCIADARAKSPDSGVPAGFVLGTGCVVPRDARLDNVNGKTICGELE